MKTKLIIGKGDDIITMILDNLSSTGHFGNITVYNNLGLDPQYNFQHPQFSIQLLNELNIENYDEWFLGVYKPEFKKQLVEKLNIYDSDKFINCIHNGLDISKSSNLGRGSLVNSKVSVAAHTNIGNFVSINRHCSIGHHGEIGDYVSINPGVNIGGHCHIGESTTIGMGAQILNGIKIGKNTVIGAGSVVTRDIPDGVVAWGSPCKIQRSN